MQRHSDRLIAGAAALVVVVLATSVGVLVLDVQRRGRSALERERTAQVLQLAKNMDTRVVSGFEGMASIAAQTPFVLDVGAPQDVATLEGIQALFGDLLETGFIVLDANGVIVNGTLLPDGALGTTFDRPGVAEALASGEPGIMPVAEGLTSPIPVTITYAPILSEGGGVRGLLGIESSASEDSAFNQEVANLRSGETGLFAFVDGLGGVVASSDPTLIGGSYPDPAIVSRSPGVYRDDGRILVVQDVPGPEWRAVSSQDIAEFEEGLGGQVQRLILVLGLAALIAAAAVVYFLLRRLRAAREEERRLAELNATREEFISIVSHELRTPVAGVLGFLQSTLDHWESMDDPARRHAIERAAANARRLHGLTRDILDTTAIEAGKLSYVLEVVELVDEVRDAVVAARDAHDDREVIVEEAGGSQRVSIDPDRIQQVLANLLDNALKNSPDESPVHVRLTGDAGFASVAITDRGPGLSESELEGLFEKFVRGRSTNVQGTGLGLYIARQIVEAHGGTLTASSSPGRGATFTFTVPLADVAAQPG